MSALTERIAQSKAYIDAEKKALHEFIVSYPQTWEEIGRTAKRMWRTDRYAIVFADGSSVGLVSTFSQRPAAFRAARTNEGRYVFDKRENVVLDPHTEAILYRVPAPEPEPVAPPKPAPPSKLGAPERYIEGFTVGGTDART